jgi:hypothetical protein
MDDPLGAELKWGMIVFGMIYYRAATVIIIAWYNAISGEPNAGEKVPHPH